MCLGVPGRIQDITQRAPLRVGRVEFGGITKEVCLSFVPEAGVGDWVVVHVGFAISQVDEEEAERIFAYLEEIGDFEELEAPPNLSSGASRPAPETGDVS